ncbi:hypothetical protein [Nostoc sp.]|uniref:hypothetical protein n=1 Tax=Nostoc sp. TaxID=1180 RepID=UPI002FF7322F
MAKTSPLRGQRLEYVVPAMGADFRLLMKESIGNWFGLTPTFPLVGVFKKDNSTPTNTNAGAKFTKRAGFRFVSYIFLLMPGTKITQPDKGNVTTTTDRLMTTISIGFPRGVKSEHTAVHSLITFILKSNRFGDIMGIITPSGIKHQWRGKLPKSIPSGSFDGYTPGGAAGVAGAAASAAAGVAGAAASAAAGVAGAAASAAAGVAGAATSAAAGLLF